MLISGISPAKELGTRANQKISGYNRIRVDGWKRFEYAACGRENFRIRKKIFAKKKKIPDTCGHGLRLNKRTRDLILWLDLFAVNIFLRLTVKIILSFLRLTAKFLAVLRLTVNPIEILLYAQFCLNKYKTGRRNALPLWKNWIYWSKL